MAKIAIKSKYITSYGGIFHVMDTALSLKKMMIFANVLSFMLFILSLFKLRFFLSIRIRDDKISGIENLFVIMSF